MYLIDTNVISEARKGARADPGVLNFFHTATQGDAGLYLSAITVGELRRGVELLRHRGDTAQYQQLETWLDELLTHYASSVLPLDQEVAQLWGRLRVPHPENSLDKQIAATALIHDLTLVTRNTRDFVDTGARLLNPFQST